MLFRSRHKNPLTDTELLVMLRGGEARKAKGLLFEQYAAAVMGVCLKYLKSESDAEDAVMDIFGYVGSKAAETDIRDLGAWLRKVAANHCLMILRRTKREIPTDCIEAAETEDIPDPMTDERLALLPLLLSSLNEAQGTCIRLFYLEEMSYQRISGQTGWDIKAVKSHIQNGKRNLGILFRKHETKHS